MPRRCSGCLSTLVWLGRAAVAGGLQVHMFSFHDCRCGGGQILGCPTEVSADTRYGILVRGLFVTDRVSWDWRWFAVADGMKFVPPDLTFKAAPTDVTTRTCGSVYMCMATNGVFVVFECVVAVRRAVVVWSA